MEFQYKKAMEANDLKIADLPEDAQIGITQIKDIEKAMHMLEKNGKKPKEKTLKKIKAMDKWVYYEILDYLQETDKNPDEQPHEKDEILDDLSDDANDGDGKDDEGDNNDNSDNVPELDENTKLGLAIEAELEKMHESGQTEWDIEDVRKVAKKTYDLLFDTYKEGEENGITTSKYSIIEKSAGEKFVLKKL
jgi:hypothetical protein